MDDVAAVLNRYTADCRSYRIASLGSAGGMSGAQFWCVHAPQGPLCLRRWPKEHPSPHRLNFIHSVLRHAESRGIEFLPVPMYANDGASFVQHGGHLWELSRWLPGKADYGQSPSDVKLRSAMTALAKFHIATAYFQLDLPPAASSAVQKRLAQLEDLSKGGANELSRAIDAAVWPELAPLARQFVAVLGSALPRGAAMLQALRTTTLPLQPCIRDIWHDHVLFTGDIVTGVVDYGAVEIDTPAGDVARLLGSLVGDDSSGWRTGLAAYCELRPLSAEESAAVRALDASGTLLAGCNWVRWVYIEGRDFENHEQIEERFRRILARTLKLAPTM